MKSPAFTEQETDKLFENLKDYLRDPNDPQRLFAKGKKIEVVYAIISKGIPLFRTEGAGDVTLLDLRTSGRTISVPAILPEKVQAKLRRQILEILRAYLDDDMKKIIEKYKGIGYVKLGDDGSWNCYIAPPIGEGETDIGMCGFCPSCNMLGAIITRKELEGARTSYGLKSRVTHDVAYAVTAYEKAVMDITHTKVGDGVSYTGEALFEEPHVLSGVVFIGKIVLYDMTEREAKLALAGLSSIKRLGAGETKYGSIQTIILGVRGGMTETISSYDIARHIIDKHHGELVDPEEVLREVLGYLKKKNFTTLVSFENKKLDEVDIQITISRDEVRTLWDVDNYNYADQVVKHIKRVEGKDQKVEGKDQARRGRKSGRNKVEEGEE